MTLKEKIERTIEYLAPKLDKLADGYVEFDRLDEAEGILTLKLFGGRLH